MQIIWYLQLYMKNSPESKAATKSTWNIYSYSRHYFLIHLAGLEYWKLLYLSPYVRFAIKILRTPDFFQSSRCRRPTKLGILIPYGYFIVTDWFWDVVILSIPPLYKEHSIIICTNQLFSTSIFMIASNSRAHKGERRGGRWMGSMDEFEGRRRMLTTGEWCNPVSNMLHLA